jgi:NADH:ubiquinone oxidoreductase subunit E
MKATLGLLYLRAYRCGLSRGAEDFIHPTSSKGNSHKSISRILNSLPLWEQRMAYLPALELIAKYKIWEERATIHCAERQKPA